MISESAFNKFSYLSIGFVAVVLILMVAKVIPVEWYVPLLVFSLILMGIRFALRFYFILKNKKNSKE